MTAPRGRRVGILRALPQGKAVAAWSCRRTWCKNGSAMANIAMTLDTCGPLFRRGDDARELAEAELCLIAEHGTDARWRQILR